MLKTVIEICVLLAIEAAVLMVVFRLFRRERNLRTRIGYIYIAAAVSVAIIIASRFIVKAPEGLLLVGAVVLCGFAGTISRMVAPDLMSQRPRPIVRVWTHNGVTGVCAEADYQLYWAQRERFWLAFPNQMDRAEDFAFTRKPHSRFTAFFTDDPKHRELLESFWTGNMKDYQRLVRGCRVEKSELWIPIGFGIRNAGLRPVTFEAARRLIHGPDAKPPEPTA